MVTYFPVAIIFPVHTVYHESCLPPLVLSTLKLCAIPQYGATMGFNKTQIMLLIQVTCNDP